jgi:predicted  nucleic acid-binding Zn-ribbon protein
MFYDRAKQERDELLNLLEQSKIALQIKDNQIAELQLALATERNRVDSMQNAYNEKAQDCADLEAILSTQQAHHEDQAARLARFEFSRLRRKRNGKHKPSDAVSDNGGSEAALAELSSLVAQRPAGSLLGQQSEGG